MLVLNYPVWFHDPFSIPQLFSWIFLFISIPAALSGFVLLIGKGKPSKNIENTTKLVEHGIYRYIRHPLYLSLMLLGTGILLKDPGRLQLILASINLVFAYLTAREEEAEMKEKFGREYIDYLERTKMFIPFVV